MYVALISQTVATLPEALGLLLHLSHKSGLFDTLGVGVHITMEHIVTVNC